MFEVALPDAPVGRTAVRDEDLPQRARESHNDQACAANCWSSAVQSASEATAGALIPFGADNCSTSGNDFHSAMDNSRSATRS